MRLPNKGSMIRLQMLILVSALVMVNSGGAVQIERSQPAATSVKHAMQLTMHSSSAQRYAAARDPRCAVWASCNGQRQSYHLAPKKAVLFAMAAGMAGS